MNENIIDMYNGDCIGYMQKMKDKSVDLLLTDIPYNEVNRDSNGLRNLDKGIADGAEFDLEEALRQFIRLTKGSIYVFCGIEQVSIIKKTFRENGLSTRLLIWEKTNPSPMNGDNIWLSSVECCVFGKFPNATFNGHCLGTVLRYPCGSSKDHPTQKPVDMFSQLVKISSKRGDVVFDPFMGSGTSAEAALVNDRKFIGCEIDPAYFRLCKSRGNTVLF